MVTGAFCVQVFFKVKLGFVAEFSEMHLLYFSVGI